MTEHLGVALEGDFYYDLMCTHCRNPLTEGLPKVCLVSEDPYCGAWVCEDCVYDAYNKLASLKVPNREMPESGLSGPS